MSFSVLYSGLPGLSQHKIIALLAFFTGKCCLQTIKGGVIMMLMVMSMLMCVSLSQTLKTFTFSPSVCHKQLEYQIRWYISLSLSERDNSLFKFFCLQFLCFIVLFSQLTAQSHLKNEKFWENARHRPHYRLVMKEVADGQDLIPIQSWCYLLNLHENLPAKSGCSY